MTLNGVMDVISRYLAEFGSFEANYVRAIEDRPIPSAKNTASGI